MPTQNVSDIRNGPSILTPATNPNIGQIVTATSSPGTDWLKCNGSVYLQSAYPQLYAQLGLINDYASQVTVSRTGWWSPTRIVYFGNNRFLAGGLGIAYSNDGLNWTEGVRADNGTSVNIDINGAAFSPTLNRWVVVGNPAWGLNCAYSDDNGITWTIVPIEAYGNFVIWSVCWCGTQFVAGGASNKIATSPDGINWTQQTNPATQTVQGIAYNGTFILASDLNGNILKSTNGIDWTVISTIATPFYSAMLYCSSMDMFFGGHYVSGISYSRTGQTWINVLYQADGNYTHSVATDGVDVYFMSDTNGHVYKLGTDLALKPILNYATITYATCNIAIGNKKMILCGSGDGTTLTSVVPSYNTATSFMVPSPALISGITSDSWILGDTQ